MTSWSLSGLSSRVDGFTLGPIDLRLDTGGAVAVIGRSGVGKTTLLRTIAGLLPPTAGRIERDGEDLTRVPPERRRLGYIPQSLALFPHRSVAGNVGYPLERRTTAPDPAELRALLDRFSLAHLAGRPTSRLSGGERQRVAIARALAAAPSLLLWDEPLSALDPTARSSLAELLGGVQRDEGIPLVVVTHDPEVAFALADRLLVLDAGRMAFVGPTTQLVDGELTAFLARFIGYENVIGRDELRPHAATALDAWLLERAGPGGLAISAEAVGLVDDASPGFVGRVRQLSPRPDGVDLRVEVEGRTVVARYRPLAGAVTYPRSGSPVRLQVDEKRIRRLAPSVGAA
ncbi:MAG: ABC transporter ATP-binding protein [Thermoplasmata archaeon]|nr:ABC transporter ATP-binding protein [Thermoplasmata archaeon]